MTKSGRIHLIKLLLEVEGLFTERLLVRAFHMGETK